MTNDQVEAAVRITEAILAKLDLSSDAKWSLNASVDNPELADRHMRQLGGSVGALYDAVYGAVLKAPAPPAP